MTSELVTSQSMNRQKRDLAFLVGLQIMAFVIANIIGHKDLNFLPSAALLLMLLTLTLLQYLLYRVTAGYARTKAFKIFYALLLVAQFVLNGMANRDVPLAETAGVALAGYTLALIVFSIVFYFVVQDMFANKHEVTYSLLAATSAYLLIATIFGYLYSVLVVLNPTVLGDVPTALLLIQQTFIMSHAVMAGFDVPASAGELLRNVAIMEAIFANLFIIFVVGRLMANQK